VKLPQHRRDVLSSTSSSDQPSCRILYRLQALDQTVGDATQKSVTVVQSAGNSGSVGSVHRNLMYDLHVLFLCNTNDVCLLVRLPLTVCSGQSPAEAEFNLLDTARKVDVYGLHLFAAHVCHSVCRFLISYSVLIMQFRKLDLTQFCLITVVIFAYFYEGRV